MGARGLPKVVRVASHAITVAEPHYLEMASNESDGRFFPTISRIDVRSDLGPANVRDSLLHECLHAVLYCHGLGKLLELDAEAEEKLVSGLAPAVLALLRRNPELVKFLLAKDVVTEAE